jgi:PP-loop superfamily ATP-utilizing enzyme
LKSVVDGTGMWTITETIVQACGRPGNWGSVVPSWRQGYPKTRLEFFSKKLGLPTWDKPSCAPGFVIPYGTPITPEKLTQVDAAEARIREQFPDSRQGSGIAVIRRASRLNLSFVKADTYSSKPYLSYFYHLGFDFVTIDLEGHTRGASTGQLIACNR